MSAQVFDVDEPIVTNQNPIPPTSRSRLTQEEFEALQSQINYEQIILDHIKVKKDMFVAHKANVCRDYDFDLNSPIGEGSFGTVYKGLEYDTQKVHALKRIKKYNITD